jgi:purine catabolism regulator
MPISESPSVTLQALVQFALPLGTVLVTGSPDQKVNYAVTVRAQPPAFPDIDGGELALVSMELLRSYDARMTLADVVRALAQAGVSAVAAKEDVSNQAAAVASELGIGLLVLPDDSNLPRIERAVNTLVINQRAQLTERALEIQRQLARLAAENRDFNSMLQIIARATAKPVVVHDDAGVLMAQVYPSVARRAGPGGRSMLGSLPYGAFQNWLTREAPTSEGAILSSPLGYTTLLKVEKRIAGYLSIIDDSRDAIEEFDRLVLTYGADVCAIELAKSRAIAFAVEQARGDWIQMWLSGTPADDDMMLTRAQQAGYDPAALYQVVVFRAVTDGGANLPLESLLPLVRDDMTRRGIGGAVGQYVELIVVLYPLENPAAAARVRRTVDELRAQMAARTPSGLVAAGISRPAVGLAALREAYREAKDAVTIAHELGGREKTTFYGDLKLFQFLLALKDRNLDTMRRFYNETLGPLAEHDDRRNGDLLRTLNGFFEANGNLAKAAADLDVHRNTLVYRLDRISELTGLNLDDADNRLILHLALRVSQVLATIPGKA